MRRAAPLTLLAATWMLVATATAAPVHHDLEVSLDPATRVLAASDSIDIGAGVPAPELLIAAAMRIDSLRVDGVPLASEGALRHGRRHIALPAGARRVEIAWRGVLDGLDTTLGHRETLRAVGAVAGPEGSFLPDASAWYPRVGASPASYRLRLRLPAGQRGLVPGTLLSEQETPGGWQALFEFRHPAGGIDLVAGPYTVTRRELRAADGRRLVLRTWFHPALAGLAEGYLDSVAQYIALYERWIGDYAFEGYSVVSSPTPTGFGMPGLAYLGVDVLRLPFIRHTSLGHEVLHDWWGNGVYVDYEAGNWAEGLTTFMADYHYRERADAGAAREMRLGWLRDLAAVPAAEDRPLVEFRGRHHGASQAVGYNKTAMLFFMLRERVGADAFTRSLARLWREHRFAATGWRDLQRAFEAETGADLDDAFTPWITRSGAPSVEVVEAVADGDAVRVTLAQQGPPWPLRVPLVLRTDDGDEHTRVVEFASTAEPFRLALPGTARSVRLDPEFRLLRRLAEGEAPPILRDLMLAEAPRVLLLEGADTGVARTLAARLFDHAPRVVSGAGGLDEGALLVIGLHAAIDAWLAARGLPSRPAQVPVGAGSATAWVSDNPRGGVVALVSLADPEAFQALLRPLPHYGRQSWLVLDGARVVERGTWPAATPSHAVRSAP